MARRPKKVETLSHEKATRTNNPTAELEGLVREEEASPIHVEHLHRNNPDNTPELYERNEDLDPQE
jgi:adenine-specific DNA-methyltransferase